MSDLKCDPELRELLPALSQEEKEQLRKNLIADGGALDPLIVWQLEGRQVLVDGYHRLEICTEENLPYKLEPRTWASKADVIAWIIEHQAGRRNLTPHQLSMLRAAVFEAEMNGDAPDGKTENSTKTGVAQSGPPAKSARETEKKVAKKTGVTRSTIQRDVAHKAAFNSLAPDVQRAIEGKEIKASKEEVAALAALNDFGPQRKAVKAVKAGEAKSIKEALKPANGKPARGEPTVDRRKFDEFETAIGKLVRQNTALKDHAGGPEYHERIRKHLNGCLETLAAWKESVLK